jgi:hypothetical protein
VHLLFGFQKSLPCLNANYFNICPCRTIFYRLSINDGILEVSDLNNNENKSPTKCEELNW